VLCRRALKTKGNTPKYGLIFHSSFIGRAKQRNKGRISRYLANKCSIASRIDCFMENSTDAFGLKLKDQVCRLAGGRVHSSKDESCDVQGSCQAELATGAKARGVGLALCSQYHAGMPLLTPHAVSFCCRGTTCRLRSGCGFTRRVLRRARTWML
jgi:hypothetical protein